MKTFRISAKEVGGENKFIFFDEHIVLQVDKMDFDTNPDNVLLNYTVLTKIKPITNIQFKKKLSGVIFNKKFH